MSDKMRSALDQALVALRRLEWSGGAGTRCPGCQRPRGYGAHACSCPINLAFKASIKAGVPPPSPRASEPPQKPCDDTEGVGHV